MDDPYRSSQRIGTCPRCQNPTEDDGELRLACVAGCGEWYPKERLAELWSEIVKPPVGAKWGAVPTPWPWTPALCPVCRAGMTVAQRDDVRFDYCGQNGLWLDAGEIQRFAQAFRPL
jgi:Zn-finger nucleic acid-binding protein